MLKRAAEHCRAAQIRVKAEEGAAEREGLVQSDVQPLNSGAPEPIRIRENGFVFKSRPPRGRRPVSTSTSGKIVSASRPMRRAAAY